jgi:hypothetical protein
MFNNSAEWMFLLEDDFQVRLETWIGGKSIASELSELQVGKLTVVQEWRRSFRHRQIAVLSFTGTVQFFRVRCHRQPRFTQWIVAPLAGMYY